METDQRFAHIKKDPRFQRMSKKQRKVRIDKRFQSMFKDKKFKLKYTVDKRGRPIHTTTNENLRKFYDLSDSENSDNDENVSRKKKKNDNQRTKKGEDTKQIELNKQSLLKRANIENNREKYKLSSSGSGRQCK